MTKKRLLSAAIYERASLQICPLRFANSDLTDLCSQRCAHWGLEHEFLEWHEYSWGTRIFYTRIFWTRITRMTRISFHAEARSAMLTFECWMLNCCVWPQCGIAQWWISMLTWWLLNENDTNEINMDSTRSFVNTHCLCSVLKVESLYSFSPTTGKQAFIVLTYRKSSKSSVHN